MLSTSSGIFSLSQTGPADLGGPAWDATVEGSQNFHYSDHGDGLFTGDSEEYILQFGGQITPTQDRMDGAEDMHSHWTTAAAVDTKTLKSEAMRRVTSKSSTGSHRSSRPHKPSSKKRESRVQSILTLTSQQLSQLDMSGNDSAFCEAPMAQGRFMDHFLPRDLDSLSVSDHMTSAVSFGPGALGLGHDGLSYMTGDASAVLDRHVNPQVFDAGILVTSPQSWGSSSPEDIRDDMWSAAATDISPPESLASESPELPNGSPRYVGFSSCLVLGATSHTSNVFRMTRNLEAAHFSVPDDVQGNVMTPAGDDGYPMAAGAFGSRRSTGDGETARDHYLYKNAYPQADGLFHCPWEGQATCNHKPEKLKCNYE
jgi:hypothetical protein